MSYTGREESFEYEALRRAEKMASKKSRTKPAGGKTSLIEKFKELKGARESNREAFTPTSGARR